MGGIAYSVGQIPGKRNHHYFVVNLQVSRRLLMDGLQGRGRVHWFKQRWAAVRSCGLGVPPFTVFVFKKLRVQIEQPLRLFHKPRVKSGNLTGVLP